MLETSTQIELIPYVINGKKYDIICYSDSEPGCDKCIYIIVDGNIDYIPCDITDDIRNNIRHIDELKSLYTLCNDFEYDVIYVSEYDVLFTIRSETYDDVYYSKNQVFLLDIETTIGDYSITYTNINLDFIDSL